MLPYIAAPWILWVIRCYKPIWIVYERLCQSDCHRPPYNISWSHKMTPVFIGHLVTNSPPLPISSHGHHGWDGHQHGCHAILSRGSRKRNRWCRRLSNTLERHDILGCIENFGTLFCENVSKCVLIFLIWECLRNLEPCSLGIIMDNPVSIFLSISNHKTEAYGCRASLVPIW